MNNKPDWLLESENKLPYWSHRNQVYHNKVAALYAAELAGPTENIEFHFNDEVLSKLPWTTEPDLTLDKCYALRARQLREKYDYLVVHYSGGSDSSTIVKTFLNNNILLDEVVTYGAEANYVNKYYDPLNLEITFSASNLLKELGKKKVKVNYINLLDSFNDSFLSVDWIFNGDPRLNADNDLKFRSLHLRTDLLDLVHQGKKVAIIFGHDKPRIIAKGNNLYLSYLDVGALGTNIWANQFSNDYIGPAQELFYANIDVPQIMIKQGHVIANWYLSTFSPQEIRSMLNVSSLYDKSYQARTNTVIYPTTWRQTETYTIGKQSYGTTWEWKSEFLTHHLKDTVQNKNFLLGIEKMKKLLPSRFLGKTGIVGHWTPLYKIRSF